MSSRLRLPARFAWYRPVVTAAVACLLLTSGGCLYHFRGGGLPADIKTIAVVPFENETTTPELQRELSEELRKALASRLGLREAPEEKANAIVRGTIRRYDVDVPVGYSADPAQATYARRQLQIVIDVEIVNQITGRTLWTRQALSAQGQYAENAEATGRKEAVAKIVTAVIEGAQSQW